MKNMTETEQKQNEVGGWGDYLHNFISASDVKDEDDEYIIVKVYEMDSDDGKKIRLDIERTPNKFVFELNKTNMAFLKNDGKIGHPKELIGKRIKFRKVMAFSPNAKKEVESLRIKAIL